MIIEIQNALFNQPWLADKPGLILVLAGFLAAIGAQAQAQHDARPVFGRMPRAPQLSCLGQPMRPQPGGGAGEKLHTETAAIETPSIAAAVPRSEAEATA